MKLSWEKYLPVAAGVLALVLLILYMGGFFATGLIDPEETVPPATQTHQPPATARAEVREVTEYFEAVGTVRSTATARIEAQIMARVAAVKVDVGAMVEEDDELVILDNRQFEAQLAQARQGLEAALAGQRQAEQGVEAAKAADAQAAAQYQRVKTYFQKGAATEQMLEEAESAHLQARAGLEQAQKAVEQAQAGVRQARKKVEEAEIAFGYAAILSPMAGEVAERLVDPGDLAVPGKPLLVLQAPKALRLDALVRESLVGRIQPGDAFRVAIDALGKNLEATIEEVVPTADPRSRTVVVKAGLPPLPGLYPGMFGRLFIPVSTRRTILIPQAAVVQIGQLQVVKVRQAGKWENIIVLTGQEYDHKVEILSGLSGGETVALEAAADG